MEKAYNRQFFSNDSPPELNDDNINLIDAALNEVDDRVVEMHTKVFTVMQHEEERQQNENKRKQFYEQSKILVEGWILAENGRVQEENWRVQAEIGRAERENSRNASENTRNRNENTRIQQENLRQANTGRAIENAQTATAAAGKATKECLEVTKRAESNLQNQEQLEATLNTAVQIRQEVSRMQSAVTAAKEQVERDKKEIEDTIQNSLLASAEQILDSVKSYFDRAEVLYQSMYFECDGETPSLRAVSPIFVDGATPAVRNMDIGVDFDGGTPTSRLLAV